MGRNGHAATAENNQCNRDQDTLQANGQGGGLCHGVQLLFFVRMGRFFFDNSSLARKTKCAVYSR